MDDVEYRSVVEYAMAGFPDPPTVEVGNPYVWEFQSLEDGGPLWRTREVEGWLWGRPIFSALEAHKAQMHADVVPY